MEMMDENKVLFLHEHLKKASPSVTLYHDGDFSFSRSWYRLEKLHQCSHCYLAFSKKARTILFCFTKGFHPGGALPMTVVERRNPALRAKSFFEHFRLDLRKIAGSYHLQKFFIDEVTWYALRLSEAEAIDE